MQAVDIYFAKLVCAAHVVSKKTKDFAAKLRLQISNKLLLLQSQGCKLSFNNSNY